MPGSQGLSFCMSRDKYKLCKAHQSPVGPHPPLALSEAVAGTGQAVKEKGRANLPVPGGCPSGVLGRGSQVEVGLQARAGHEQDAFSLGPGGRWQGMYSLQRGPPQASASPPSAPLQPAVFLSWAGYPLLDSTM